MSDPSPNLCTHVQCIKMIPLHLGAAATAQQDNGYGGFLLQDYQMQLLLLERQDKKRLLMACQEQNSMTGFNHGPMLLSVPSTPALQRRTVSVNPVPYPPRSGRNLQTAMYFEAESTRVETSLFSHHRTAAQVNERSGLDWVHGSSGATLLVAAPAASKGLESGVTVLNGEKLPSTDLLGENGYLSSTMKEEEYTPISNSNSNFAHHSYTGLEAGEKEKLASRRWRRASSIVKNIGVVLVWLALIACAAYISAVIFWYGDRGQVVSGWLD